MGAVEDYLVKMRDDVTDLNDLRGHIGVGVSELEAGLLSGEARVREISEPLRKPVKYCRSELHVSALPHREVAARLDRGDTGELPIRYQSAPENHACCPAARHCGFHFRFYPIAAAAGRGQDTP